jgi:hypothetical protein
VGEHTETLRRLSGEALAPDILAQLRVIVERDLPRNELIFSRVWALALPSPDGKERSYGREMPLRHWFLLDQERQKGSSGQAG